MSHGIIDGEFGQLVCRFDIPQDAVFGIPVVPTSLLPLSSGRKQFEPLFDERVLAPPTVWHAGGMTPTRQAALSAAINVWSVEVEDDVIPPLPAAQRILHLAETFERWLDRPVVSSLTLTPGEIRRIAP